MTWSIFVRGRRGKNTACTRRSGDSASSRSSPDLFEVMGDEGDVEAEPDLDSHWYRAQCRRLIKAAKDSKRIWWLIFDALSQSPEVVEFVHHLAHKVASLSQKHIRLVLLDHPKEANQGLPTGAGRRFPQPHEHQARCRCAR